MDRKAHQQQPLSGSRVLDLPERASGDGTGVEAIILEDSRYPVPVRDLKTTTPGNDMGHHRPFPRQRCSFS